MGQIFETGYEVNVSHIIHDLSFGPSYPGVHNPLDGSERILHDISGTFKYFLKVGSLNISMILALYFWLFSVTAIVVGLLLSYIEVSVKMPEIVVVL